MPIDEYAFKRLFNKVYSWLKNTPAVWEMYFNNGSDCKNTRKIFVCIANTAYPVLSSQEQRLLFWFHLFRFFFFCCPLFSVSVVFFFLLFRLVTSDLYLNLFSQALIHSFFFYFCLYSSAFLLSLECACLAPCTRTDGIVFHVCNNEYFFLLII